MANVSKLWFVIINPTSGNGTSKKKWPEIKRLLNHYKFHFKFAFTEYEKHSIKLVHQAINENITHIISIGGDGTLHNIVNGIMTQNVKPSSQINVGVIPIGTGNDWVKTHNIPKDLEAAIQIIKNEKIKRQDLGEIEFTNNRKPSIFFNNLAGIGFDGYVVSKVSNYKNIGALAYLYGALISLFSFKNFRSKTYVNTKEVSSKTLMILVGLCKFSGGGMQLTKDPNPFDGLLDISIAKDLNKWEIIKNLHKLFNGKIVNYKKVESFKSDKMTIKVKQKDLPLIQADGELIGKGNITISVIPKAFSFFTNT